jgi:hypothetical protein
MKYLISSMLVIGLLISPAVAPAQAEQAGAGKKIRVLLTYGGHAFEEEAFFATFDAMGDVEYTKAKMPDEAGLLKPGLEKQYDCIVMYDMCKPAINPEQQKAFLDLLARGIGLVSLHHNVGAHAGWDGYRKIIGGQFIFADCEIEGKPYKQTPWAHGEDLKISVVDPNHPITKGVGPFEIHDETYGVFYTAGNIKPLLTTDHPKNNPVVAWTTQCGKSPVFYLMLGHDGVAYANPSFRKVLHQGIRWAAGR